MATVITHGMSSADRLKFLEDVISLRIWTWLGWIAAIIVIFIARFLLKQQREIFNRSLSHSDNTKETVLKQAELSLENPNPPK